jgi:two-component system, NarL family, sensor kinase
MQEDRLNMEFVLIVSTLLVLMLSGLLVTLFYISQNRALRLDRTIFDLKHNHDRNIMEATLEMQELTFEHISLEIHDNIIHSISLANVQLASLERIHDQDATTVMNSVMTILRDAVNDLSNISKGLNRDLIQSQGLLTAVNVEVQRLKNLKLFSVNLIITGDPVFMHDGKEVLIFRIIQEAFQNVIKHSEATEASLTLSYTDHQLQIDICDNGKGYPTSEEFRLKHRSTGLANMKKRVQRLNGQMFRENTNPGTIISIKIPTTNDK